MQTTCVHLADAKSMIRQVHRDPYGPNKGPENPPPRQGFPNKDEATVANWPRLRYLTVIFGTRIGDRPKAPVGKFGLSIGDKRYN